MVMKTRCIIPLVNKAGESALW